jgi:hypothetical protein
MIGSAGRMLAIGGGCRYEDDPRKRPLNPNTFPMFI